MVKPTKEYTPEDIWKMFAETDRRFRESDKRFQETQSFIAKIIQETNDQIQEINDQIQETNDQIQATNDQVKATNDQVKATNDQVKTTNKKFHDLADKWGEFVEGLVIPATERMLAERGITVRSIHPNVKVSRNGQEGMEIDIMAVNGEYVVLIEVKSTLGVRDVKEHLKRIAKFKTYFREYANHKIVGAVSGIVIKEDVDKYAYKKGLFVIAQSGDSVKIINDQNFKPTEW